MGIYLDGQKKKQKILQRTPQKLLRPVLMVDKNENVNLYGFRFGSMLYFSDLMFQQKRKRK